MNRLIWVGCVAVALAGCKEVKPERAASNIDGINRLIAVSQAKADNANDGAIEGEKAKTPPAPTPPAPKKPKIQ